MLNVAPETDDPPVYDFGLQYQQAVDHFNQPSTQAAVSAAVGESQAQVKKTRDLLTIGAGVILLAAVERLLSHTKHRKIFVIGTGKVDVGGE
jgi:hypothetical protein